jgi:hypothetical protein
VRGFVPHGHWRSLTFLGALRCDRPLRLRRPHQRRMLPCYVEQQLVPVLKPADIVIMDNLAATSQPCCAALSGPPMPGSGTCRPTPTISIRSSRPSPRSSTACAQHTNALSRTLGATSAALSLPSNPANATTTSQTPDTLPAKHERLQRNYGASVKISSRIDKASSVLYDGV